jgi:hypothetical protein
MAWWDKPEMADAKAKAGIAEGGTNNPAFDDSLFDDVLRGVEKHLDEP